MESFVEVNAGVGIASDETLGQIAIATRNYELYDVILREKPALVWKTQEEEEEDDYDGFEYYLAKHRSMIQSYSQTNTETQRLIVDMYTQEFEPDDPRTMTVQLASQRLVAEFPQITEAEIHHLIPLTATNFHYLKRDSNRDERAVFLLASKIQHSCSPNAAYSVQDGRVVYRVIRRIQKGETITCTRGGMMDSPTVERRSFLSLAKNFWCECDKCMEQDYSRMAFCDECHARKPCGAITEEPEDDMELSYDWVCPRGHYNDKVTKLEELLAIQLEDSMEGPKTGAVTRKIWQLRKEVSTQLSPVHYIAVRAWKNLAAVYRDRAAHPSFDSLRVEQLKQQAAISELCFVALLECSSSRCCGCRPGISSHEMVHGLTENVIRACKDLLDIPISMVPVLAEKIIPKYMAAMKHWGDANLNIDDLECLLEAIADSDRPRQCHVCSSKAETLLYCSRCKLAGYCSKDCQIKAWKQGHKQECLSIP